MNTSAAPPAPVSSPAQKTNVLAIVALATSFVVGLAGIVCGAIALGQIKRRGEGGRGLAIAGIVVGSVTTFLSVLGVVAIILAFAGLFGGIAATCAELGPGVHEVGGVTYTCG
ncbi:DUF4190 domain-containing protein [Leifsonia sp. C5G2]|uniref:DUF4190 domain-containing protein n=1 Tax=Leifsonia sp. C5G2 TaxID=2735269 RepID=UPI0015859922|nr:DUF4190 domain-containing protein [Leifsonia sp. C5G2]NUU07570.1 DUF4190 domain-containing protein [Leifsonia sp. C5G2]